MSKNFDFPAEEIPFPAKKGSNSGFQVPDSKFQISDSSELHITGGKLQNESEVSDLKSEHLAEVSKVEPEHLSEISNLNSQIEIAPPTEIPNLETEINDDEIIFDQPQEYQKPANIDEYKTDNGQATTDSITLLQSPDFLNSIKIKLMPLTEEELEHIDDKNLDETYERKLSRLGDNLFPIKNASKIVEIALQLNAVKIEVSNGNSTATAAAPARDVSAFMPNLDEDETETELPVLSENPTEEEMLAYAHAHPLVKKALRIFRGKISIRKD